MENLLRANTLRLEEHADMVRRERNTARLLVDQLRLARRYALPEDTWRYDRMIGKAETLVRYFSGMADQVDNMGLELARLSVDINTMLKEAGSQLGGQLKGLGQ